MNILHHQALAMKYMFYTKVMKLYVKKMFTIPEHRCTNTTPFLCFA